MHETNRVVVLRIERSEPVHISEVISELLPELARRPEPAAGKMQVVSRSGIPARKRQAENTTGDQPSTPR